MRVINESYPMNTNMTGFRWFSKTIWVLALWTKVASELKGLSVNRLRGLSGQTGHRQCQWELVVATESNREYHYRDNHRSEVMG